MSLDHVVQVPDIGDFKDVPIIEILVKTGDAVAKDAPLVVLETDKATMEVPSPAAGIIKELRVAIGDKVSQGSAIVLLGATGQAPVPSPPTPTQSPEPVIRAVAEAQPASVPQAPASGGTLQLLAAAQADAASAWLVRASPSVRKLARQLGVDLTKPRPTGLRGRLLRDDVEHYVRDLVSSALPTSQPRPEIDFAKFGPIDRQPLSRIRKITGANLTRNWTSIPHVTNFDEADITDLEAFRQDVNRQEGKSGTKVTLLAFVIKAAVQALQKHTAFNASLDGDSVVYKRYFHIGFAVDTAHGLVVPVLRNADRMGIFEIARATAALAETARLGKLKPDDMQGGCFSISSLGSIGGTGFTPIINAPEIAILGMPRAKTSPLWDGAQFRPRLMLPLQLSWDHRAVDGAAAARFLVELAGALSDVRRCLL